jgi:hypothetical protein
MYILWFGHFNIERVKKRVVWVCEGGKEHGYANEKRSIFDGYPCFVETKVVAMFKSKEWCLWAGLFYEKCLWKSTFEREVEARESIELNLNWFKLFEHWCLG